MRNQQSYPSLRKAPLKGTHARKSLAPLSGGCKLLAEGLGPTPNINVSVKHNIPQLLNIEVNALNNVGVIGTGFGAVKLDFSALQWANASASLCLPPATEAHCPWQKPRWSL